MRHVFKSGVIGGLLLILSAAQIQPAHATEFQNRASINDPNNEVIATTGGSRTRNVPSNERIQIQLIPGETYGLRVSGTFSYAPSDQDLYLGDAECTTLVDGNWQAQRFTSTYGSDLVDLKPSGGLEFDWKPENPFLNSASGESSCSQTHTYTATFVPATDQHFVDFSVNDPAAGDNAGSLTLTLSRGPFSRPRVYEQSSYQCPKWTEEPLAGNGGTVGEIQKATLTVDSLFWTAFEMPFIKDESGVHLRPYWYQSGHFGVYSCNWALPGSVYRITVEGTYSYDRTHEAPFAIADAECATGLADPVWFYNRYPTNPMNIKAYNDHMDLYLNRENIWWTPNVPDSSGWCSLDHKYSIPAFTPKAAGPLYFQLYDFAYQETDNQGQLRITIERIG